MHLSGITKNVYTTTGKREKSLFFGATEKIDPIPYMEKVFIQMEKTKSFFPPTRKRMKRNEWITWHTDWGSWSPVCKHCMYLFACTHVRGTPGKSLALRSKHFRKLMDEFAERKKKKEGKFENFSQKCCLQMEKKVDKQYLLNQWNEDGRFNRKKTKVRRWRKKVFLPFLISLYFW